MTNSVFVVESDEGSFVIRLDPSTGKSSEYRKERWAIDHARRLDIPAPNVIAVGATSDGISYMLSRRERGHPASELPDTQPVLRQLGQYIGKFHGTGLNGSAVRATLRPRRTAGSSFSNGNSASTGDSSSCRHSDSSTHSWRAACPKWSGNSGPDASPT